MDRVLLSNQQWFVKAGPTVQLESMRLFGLPWHSQERRWSGSFTIFHFE